ncbi:MAG: hypothetical protein QGF21_04180 [Vicinamibacterales bacterium]|jgi:hypothetical protein|nr:hypothetical protein [Vicinamibacterales bacterium]MDP7479486.1 hypothetical protein [Vicinamibacterales bacterium]MDP7671127.1 hypothetical protein [Vicinamibacterales bacterium]HJO39917.1 hypothetical protein [Vicinamibacterales bacterium]|tara:strand:- start:4791 stop:4970 length:180 start_codon:yes stop_codon:yes gene_type:complete
MANHFKLWYLQRLRLLDVLNGAQKATLEHASQMSEIRRRERIYLPGDPSDRLYLLKAGA